MRATTPFIRKPLELAWCALSRHFSYFDIQIILLHLHSNIWILIRRGPEKSPASFKKTMITETQIRQLVLEKLEGTSQFLVEAKVAGGNKINVMVDAPEGMPIKDVVSISRHIEGSFDREKEDFELTVSSPGLDLPFKVLQQYLKYIGKEVEVKAGSGKRVEGILLSADEEGIVVETSEKLKLEGKKKKELVVTQHVFKFESTELSQKINECKVVITF